MMAIERAGEFAQTALARIAEILEDSAPVATRRLPLQWRDQSRVLESLKTAGLEIAALAQAAIAILRSGTSEPA